MSAIQAALASPDQQAAGTETKIVIETRFGSYEFTEADSLYLPQGLLGFGNYRRFGLATLPNPKLEAFNLLQSLEDGDLSFIVKPFGSELGLIKEEDLQSACETVDLTMDNATFMLIVTARKEEEGVSLSVNLRAPIIVNKAARTARQIVLHNPDYPVRFDITARNAS